VRYEDIESGVVYTFNHNSGKLIGIDNLVDNSSIAVEHRGQDYPVLFTHSNGKTLNITYTDSGLISYADLLDEDNNIEKTRFAMYIISVMPECYSIVVVCVFAQTLVSIDSVCCFSGKLKVQRSCAFSK